MRPTCWHQNFGPNGLSAPAQGLCLNIFSSITADFNISSAIRWAIQDQWSSGSVMETTYADSWSDMAQSCDNDLWVMKWRSAWPILHSPVILPYIFKTISFIYTILWDYESVWSDVWPKNKCRSLWPIFYGPVIFALYLEDYLMYEHHYLGLWISMTRPLTSK